MYAKTPRHPARFIRPTRTRSNGYQWSATVATMNVRSGRASNLFSDVALSPKYVVNVHFSIHKRVTFEGVNSYIARLTSRHQEMEAPVKLRHNFVIPKG